MLSYEGSNQNPEFTSQHTRDGACGLALPLTLDKTTSGAFFVVRDLDAMQQLCIFHQSRLFAKASTESLP